MVYFRPTAVVRADFALLASLRWRFGGGWEAGATARVERGGLEVEPGDFLGAAAGLSGAWLSPGWQERGRFGFGARLDPGHPPPASPRRDDPDRAPRLLGAGRGFCRRSWGTASRARSPVAAVASIDPVRLRRQGAHQRCRASIRGARTPRARPDGPLLGTKQKTACQAGPGGTSGRSVRATQTPPPPTVVPPAGGKTTRVVSPTTRTSPGCAAANRRGQGPPAPPPHRRPHRAPSPRPASIRSCADLVQVALIQLIEAIPRYRGECPLDGWVARSPPTSSTSTFAAGALERSLFLGAVAADGDDLPGEISGLFPARLSRPGRLRRESARI